MMHLQFAHPQWLWLGALGSAAVTLLLVRAARLRRRAASHLAGARFVTTVSGTRRLLKQTLLVLAVAAGFGALARPQAGFRWEQSQREGIDLMFAVDTSKSMLATDLRPDRLTRAKLAVSDLLREFPGERAGLIAFAGDAFVQAPMTIDHDIFGEALDALDTGIIARGGTNIAAPIRAAIQAMATEPDRRKLLVIVSDGEDLQGQGLAAAQEAAHAGLVIYTVGVGTPAGDLIPIIRDGQQQVMRDDAGQPVRSRLDEAMMRKLAETTGGAYAALGPSGRGLETLYRQYLAHLPRRTVAERLHKVYTERFQYPLALAIACLLLELVLSERRRTTRARGSTLKSLGSAAAAVAAFFLIGAAQPAQAATATSTPTPKATSSVSQYNDGTAAYRQKDFPAAERQFHGATRTTDLGVQADAYYDLGNARYRVGQGSLAKDRSATIDAWKNAVASYDGALALRPQDADARFNRELVSRRLAALEQQQKQDQKQNQKQSEQKQPQGAQNQPDQKNQSGQKKDKSAGKQPQQSSAGGGSSGQQNNGPGPEPKPAQKTGEQKNAAANAPQPQAGQPQAGQRQAGGPGVVSGQAGQPGEKDRAPAARREPGALSASEAEQLLNSVSGEMRHLPIASARRQQPNHDDSPLKDW
ncbi:MAG TPA: VWA domain-containing protein [Polyangia bacterium]|nr:VWA domain-containing protein [Polyangia bacterium]